MADAITAPMPLCIFVLVGLGLMLRGFWGDAWQPVLKRQQK